MLFQAHEKVILSFIRYNQYLRNLSVHNTVNIHLYNSMHKTDPAVKQAQKKKEKKRKEKKPIWILASV